MTRDDLQQSKKQLDEQLQYTQQLLKENRRSMDEYEQVSREGSRFLQETASLFRGSLDYHVFEGILEQQLHLDKKIVSELEREKEEYLQEYRRVTRQQEEVVSQLKQLGEEETHGN